MNKKIIIIPKNKKKKCFINSNKHLQKRGHGKIVLILKKRNKKKNFSNIFIKMEKVIMIEFANSILVILAILAIFFAVKFAVKLIRAISRARSSSQIEYLSEDNEDTSQISQMQDNDITKEDANTFLKIIELLNQLYS